MAKTTKSTLFEQFDRATSIRPDSIEAEGRVCYLNDTVVFDADNVVTDVINLLPGIPKGALVDLAKSEVIGAAMTAVTVSIGTTADIDLIGTDIALNAAGTRAFDADAPALVEWPGGDLLLTVSGGDPGASTQRVSVAYYVR